MNKTKAYASAVVILAMILVIIAAGQSNSRQERELRMADQAILASLAVSQSPAGKSLCLGNEIACVGPDKSELGLALIGARPTPESRSALTNLLAYRLDGSVSEDFQCYVLNAGPAIESDLRNVDPDRLRAHCSDELHKLIRSRRASFKGLDENAVCADPNRIRAKANELAGGVKRGIKCSADEF